MRTKVLKLSIQEELEQDVFGAIQSIAIEKIMVQAEQRSEAQFKSYIAKNLKQILNASKHLSKIKHPINKKTIAEMIESVAYDKSPSGEDGFLDVIYSEYLEGTAEEKKAIVAQVDLSKLTSDTFALVTKYLKSKGQLKKKKGFGKL